MARAVTRFPWTHYTVRADGSAHVYSMEECETWRQPVQAPNAVGMSIADAEGSLMLRLNREPPEQSFNTETGICECEGCRS